LREKVSPPSVPSVETMKIDFSEFVNNKKSVTAIENTNWTNASTIAGIWNNILAINLAVPVVSFNLAVSKTPVSIEANKWQWSYDVSSVGATYKARLTGEIRATDVKWEMYVAREGAGAFAEFKWFEGTSALDGKSGQWIINHSQLFQEPLLQIDWVITDSKVGNIKYTYIRDLKDNRTADTFKGSNIEYGLTTATLNAFYNVHVNLSGTPNDFKDVFIEWSTSAHNGHIKALYYYGDSNWRCWDGNGNDVTCN
jgi:hypothetical protein